MVSGASSTSVQQPVSEPDYKALESAANWFAILRSDQACAADHLAWQAWLKQSDAHARAWSYIEAVSQRFDPLRGTGHQAAVAGLGAARREGSRRRQVLAGLVGMLGLGIAGGMGWRHSVLPETITAWGADYRTAVGEQREVTLADGSHVWLNTRSALRVDYQADSRLLELSVGEILVQTARDADRRPFYVSTRHGRMQALGTRFSVWHDNMRTRLDVFESKVEIRNVAGAVRQVSAGESVEFTAHGISAPVPAERSREAWRRGMVVADNIPLQALVEDLARYQHGHISVAPEVAGLIVMGVFPANDVDRAFSMLENTLPIRVRRTLPWWLKVEAR